MPSARVRARISNTRLLKLLLIAIYVGLFLFFSVQEGIAQPGDYGTPEVEKYVFPSSVESGDPVTVSITVTGCSGEVDTPIPFDGVLLIDMSGSMNENDPNDLRLDAAISFISCVSDETRLAIASFSTGYRLVQGLTEDKQLLENRINGLRGKADGYTNIYGGMQIAQEHLIDFGSYQREWFIILLTDGIDTSEASDLDFINLANIAADHGIRYYTIALGDHADLLRLFVIADLTGGKWFLSADASQLGYLYSEICQEASYMVSTREITLWEKLNPGVWVVPGSVEHDIEGITQAQIDQFVTTGAITAYIGTLGSGEGRFIQFDVVSDCLTPDSEEETVDVSIDHPNSKVTYIWGIYEGEVEVPQRTFECTRPGDLWVGKVYDFESALLSITLKSRYPSGVEDRIIRNIKVIENPSIFFQPNLSSASPPIDLAFRGSITDKLVWNIPELGPAEVKTLTIELEPRICSSQYYPPIDVNAQKETGNWPGDIYYTRPDGTFNSIEMPLVSTSLSTVDPCVGRPDIYIVPAYTLNEYSYTLEGYWSPEIDPTSVLYKYESEKIWVDSSAEQPRAVSGQGDLFYLNSENAIIAEIVNTGLQSSEMLPDGVKLFVYNYDSPPSWEIIGTTTLPAVQSLDLFAGAHELVKIELPPNTLQSAHLRPYTLSLDEAMQLISKLDSGLAYAIRVWAREHPSEWDSLSQELIRPKDLRNALPYSWLDPRFGEYNLREKFKNFLNNYGDMMAWGKPSFIVKIVFEAAASEKHTNNNWATEKIIVDNYPELEISAVPWDWRKIFEGPWDWRKIFEDPWDWRKIFEDP